MIRINKDDRRDYDRPNSIIRDTRWKSDQRPVVAKDDHKNLCFDVVSVSCKNVRLLHVTFQILKRINVELKRVRIKTNVLFKIDAYILNIGGVGRARELSRARAHTPYLFLLQMELTD